MVERSAVTQVVQIGVEATPGTVVPANRKLQSISIAPSVEADTKLFRAAGSKFPSVQALNKEWSVAPISGVPTYTELMYLLACVITTPTTTSPAAGVHRHVFTPSSTAADDPKTLTIEQGGSVRAHRAAYGMVTDLGLSISREDVTIDGSIMARAIADGITMTAAPTELALVPILPSQWSVYLDATAGAIGTTKLGRVLSVDWGIGGRWGPLWVVDAAQASWAAHVESVPDLGVSLTVEADAEGMALLERLRDGATRFMRIEAVGPLIDATNPYRLRLDQALKVNDAGDFGDEQEVMAIDWDLKAVHDAGWGKSMTIELQNAIASL